MTGKPFSSVTRPRSLTRVSAALTVLANQTIASSATTESRILCGYL